MMQSNTFMSGFSNRKIKWKESLYYALEKAKKHRFISLSVIVVTGAAGSLVGTRSQSNASFSFDYDFAIKFLLFLFIGCVAIFIFYLLRYWIQNWTKCWRHSIWEIAFDKAQELKSKVQSIDENSWDETIVKTFLTEACENIKDFYAEYINSDCGVSIKMSKTETSSSIDTWEFSNFCRASGREQRDSDKRYLEKHHFLLDNTAFLTIINQLRNHEEVGYVNNDIHASHDYKSSSFGCYDEQFGYDSELVYPIVPFRRELQYQAIHGFICIDSKDTDKFDEKLHDIQLVKEYADIITHILTIKNK